MAIRFGPVPNLDGNDGPVPISIYINDELYRTAPMTAQQLKELMEEIPDPDKVYDSATIQEFTSRKYIMKKAAKYHPIPMSMYISYFGVRDRKIIVEPTLLTDFFDQKSRVTIEDLITYAVESVTPENKYFLCRTIRPPWIETEEITMTSTGLSANIYLVVEDPEGKKTIAIELYNYPRRWLDDIIEEFPVGIVLAISNPQLMHQSMGSSIDLHFTNESYAELKQTNKKIGHLIIPSDEMIEKLYPNGLKWNSPIPSEYQKFVVDIQYAYHITTPDGWKKLGNVHYARKNFDEAGIAYGKGLEFDPKNVILLSNRAAAYVEQEKYGQALHDANEVLEIDPKHVKAALRKAKSLAGLKLFKESGDFIQEQMKIQPEVIDFRPLLDKVNASSALHQ